LGFDQKKNVVDREEKGRINNYKWKKADLRFWQIAKLGKETQPHIHAIGKKKKGLHMEMEKNNSD